MGYDKMAVAGAMTVAYKCRVVDNTLVQTQTTYPTGLCKDAKEAMVELEQGCEVIVSGFTKTTLNRMLLAAGVTISS